jgi:hypothetical protein
MNRGGWKRQEGEKDLIAEEARDIPSPEDNLTPSKRTPKSIVGSK